MMLNGKDFAIILIVMAAAALYLGYWYGDKKGYDRGFSDAVKAQAQSQETGAQVDTGYQNPFEGVKFNPFK